MLLDIYRDQALAKLLIVEHRKNIKDLASIRASFMDGLKHQRNIDTDSDKLPTGINKDDVLKAINEQGYYATTLTATILEIDTPS